MNSSTTFEYLEKYSVAPSPSRDYYGIKVLRDQIILYTWKISHGPHTNPIVRVSRFCDFTQEKTMQNEIQRVFGEPIFKHVESIAGGNESSLLTLPKHLIKRLTAYLTFNDVLRLSRLSHVANEVFNGDVVWELLYKRHKMGLVYRDEREQGSSRGWKRLFEERQMHKPARNRMTRKVTSDRQIDTPRAFVACAKRPSSSLSLKKNQTGITSAAKLVDTEIRTQRFPGSKSNRNSNGRPDTASKKKPDADIEGCKLLSTKMAKGGDDLFDKKIIKVKRQEEPDKDLSVILKSRNVRYTGGKCSGKGVFENKANSKTMTKKSEDKISAVSVIAGVEKNCDEKSGGSLKKFSNLGRKSNPTSGRGVKSKASKNTESLTTRFGQMMTKDNTKKKEVAKGSGKSEIYKSGKALLRESRGVYLDENSGLEELIRASITEKYLSSENLLPCDFWRDRNCESNSKVEKTSARKLTNPDFRTGKNKPTIYQRFSTPRKPGAATKSAALASTVKNPEIPARKFADIKVYLKCNRKSFCGDEPDSGHDTTDVKSSSMKMAPNAAATKYKNRNLPKTESCDNLHSKFVSNASPRLLGPKKGGNFKK